MQRLAVGWIWRITLGASSGVCGSFGGEASRGSTDVDPDLRVFASGIHPVKPVSRFFRADARRGISPRKANVAIHVKVGGPSQSGRQLLPLLKLPSTLRNEGN